MIYNVSWIEKRRRQRIFFNSLSHAKYFAKRLGRMIRVEISTQESDLQAA